MCPTELLLLHLLLGNRMRCKATRGEENEEPVLLCSRGGVTPDIFVGMMLSKLERERARSGDGTGTCQIRGRENLLYALAFELSDCQNMHQFVR